MDPPRKIRLHRVQYQPPGGSEQGWSLLLTWTAEEIQPGEYRSLLQLYQDVTLRTPLGNAVSATADGPGVWSQQAAGVTLEPGTHYWIAVLDDRPNKPKSNPVTVLWQPMELALLRYQPEHLDIGWVPPKPPFNNYEVTLTSPAGDWLTTRRLDSLGYCSTDGGVRSFRLDFGSMPLSTFAGRLPFSLRPIYVEQDGAGADAQGVGAGPQVDAQLYVDPPAVVSAEFSGGDTTSGLDYLLAVKTPGDTTPAPRFQVAVTWDGRAYTPPALADSQPGPDQSHLVGVRVIASDQQGHPGVPAGAAFAALVARADSLRQDRPERISVGPQAAPVPLLTAAPEVISATYHAAVLTVTLAQPPGKAALVTVSDGQAEVAQVVVAGSRGTVPFDAQPGHGYSVTAAGLAGSLLGPPGPAVSLVTEPPALRSAGYDGALASASWAQPGGPAPDAYLVKVRAAGVPIAEVSVGGTTAALPVSVDGPVTIEVAAVLAAAEGPACPPVSLLTSAPTVTRVTTDPVTGIAKVFWRPVPDADGYTVQRYENGRPVGPATEVPDTDWKLPEAVAPGTGAAVTVAALSHPATAGVAGPAVTVTGPAITHRLPATPAVIESVSYNGVAAAVTWRPAAGASGFEVSVLSDGAVLFRAEAGADSANATLPVPLTPAAGGYTAVVQVLAGDDSGPPATPRPLLAPALFLSTERPAAKYPYLYPAVNPMADATDIVAYLPELGSAPLTQPEISEPPFELSATGDPAFPYRLRIPGDSDAWAFGPALGGNPVRPNIKTAYLKLLVAVEDAGGSAPGIIALQEVIARVLPQTFAETLYYGWGIDGARRTVDLRPGMVLQVGVADYNYPGMARELVTGYLGGPVIELEVGSYLGQQDRWRVGFDAFVAQLVTAGNMQVDPPPNPSGQSQGGVAAAADLFFDGLCQPFYRLFAPSTLQTPSGFGSSQTTANFVLAAAANFKTLQQVKNTPDPRNPVAYFRGRAVAVPAARVTVNGSTEVVPLGTTVGNVLDRYRAGPPATRAALAGLAVYRQVGPTVLAGEEPPAAGITAGAVRAVRFDWQDMAVYGTGFDALSLPLLPGDRLSFGS